MIDAAPSLHFHRSVHKMLDTAMSDRISIFVSGIRGRAKTCALHVVVCVVVMT